METNETQEGMAQAIRDLDLAVKARTVLIGIETSEEAPALKAIRSVADRPVIGLGGNAELESRAVFQWTHTNGIVRLGDLPNCPQVPSHGQMTMANSEAGKIYRCPSCQHEQGTEFPEQTADPSFAIQDFITYAIDDGTAKAYAERASILVLCDIHRFLMGPSEGGEPATRTMRALRDLASMLPPTKSLAILLAPQLSNLGDADRHIHRINWPLPTMTELVEMVKKVGEKMDGRIPVDLNGQTEDLAASLAALTMEEAKRVLKLVMVKHRKLDGDLAPILMGLKAEILESASGIKLTRPQYDLDDVGGLERVKEAVVRIPMLLTQAAKDENVRAPRGILFGGPPGTGKSLLAEVVASAANMPLLAWDLGQTKSKWHGETERQVGEVLRAADAISRCVLWIDEGEKQMGGGGDDTHEVTESIMGTILGWMQSRTSDVIVVMTVNHPERLRPELLSRFDDKWFVDYPDVDACAAILDIHTTRRGTTLSETDLLHLGRLAADRELCGREIEHAIEQAKRDAYWSGRSAGADDIEAVMASTAGLSSQPQRRDEIVRMRSECLGQFKAAGQRSEIGAANGRVVTKDQMTGDDLGVDL